MGTMLDPDLLCKDLADPVRAMCAAICGAAASGTPLSELDEVVRDEVLKLGDHAMASVARRAGQGLLDLPPAPCPKCARPMVFKQWREFVLRCATTGRPQTARSPYVTCQPCKLGRLLLRDALGVDRDGLTVALRRKATLAGTVEPFEEASARLLSELAGITLSGTKVHGLCQQAGAAAVAKMQHGTLGESRLLERGETLYVEADGGMLWLDDGWHEVKLAVLFPSRGRGEVSKGRKEVTERQFVVTLGGPDDLGKLIWEAAQRWLPLGPGGVPQVRGRVVFLADGAVWLRQMAEQWLPGARVVLDFYHVAEHIASAARVLHPHDELARKRWCHRQRHLLLDGAVDEMLGGLLVEARDKRRSAEQRAELEHLHDYLSERRAGLCYLVQRAQGLDIGSGPAESGINHVLQQRMKRAGMRWDRPGGTAMSALRCAYRSRGGMRALWTGTDRRLA